MRQVYKTNDVAEAYHARGRLWAAGIQTLLHGQDLSAQRHVQWQTAAALSLWVDDADLARAQATLGQSPDL